MEVKDVCFVRHAKSSWDQPGLKDFDRPLDSRGLHDAPMMARKMKELDLIPDYIISSGANRAKSTEMNNDLYEASAETVYEVLRSAPDTARFVFLFGHNPTFTWVANSIAGVHIDEVPTCGIVHAQAMISSWSKFKPEYAGFIGFHYPKQYKK